MGVGVKVPDGQGLHVLEELIPQVPQGALGHVDHHPGLDEAGQDAAGVEQATRTMAWMRPEKSATPPAWTAFTMGRM